MRAKMTVQLATFALSLAFVLARERRQYFCASHYQRQRRFNRRWHMVRGALYLGPSGTVQPVERKWFLFEQPSSSELVDGVRLGQLSIRKVADIRFIEFHGHR
jgi:hypothetical protein